MNPLDKTAQDYFAARVANGAIPREILGGALDGLRYFRHELDGHQYLLSEIGLLEPEDLLPGRSMGGHDAGSQQM